MLNERHKALIHDLINIAWKAGAVRSPQMGQMLDDLRAELLKKDAPPAKERKK